MEPTSLTLEVLRAIQTTLVGVREDLAGTNARLDRLERTTNERLTVIDERLGSIDVRLGGIDGRLGGIDERLGTLEQHAVATREAIDLLRTQAIMAGQALTVQMQARHRLDERVDRLEDRVDALERKDD